MAHRRRYGSSVKIMLGANDLFESLFQIFSGKMYNAPVTSLNLFKNMLMWHIMCAANRC